MRVSTLEVRYAHSSHAAVSVMNLTSYARAPFCSLPTAFIVRFNLALKYGAVGKKIAPRIGYASSAQRARGMPISFAYF